VLLNQRCEALVVLDLAVQRLAPCSKPQEQDEGGQPAKNFWTSTNLVESLDEHHLYEKDRLDKDQSKHRIDVRGMYIQNRRIEHGVVGSTTRGS
jgi:hypothetical protein